MKRATAFGLVSVAVVGAGLVASCYQQHYPIVDPNPVSIESQCLAPAQPMAGLKAAPGDGFPSAACVERAKALVATMPRRLKFGQMMQPDRGTIRSEKDLSYFGLGSILSGGGSGPPENNPMAWVRMVNEFREQSLSSETKIPVIYGIDAVHGHNNVKGAVIFPHNIGLGATRDADLVERIGRVTAREVAATNIDWAFSPVLAIVDDERWGRTYESFGESPELPNLLGPALIRGLQGERLGRSQPSVLACAKHYIGDGNTTGGDDQGDSRLDPERIERELLPAYEAAIAAGVGSVMISYSSIDGIKMHCHGPLINDTLKGRLGFNGLVVSDWEAVEKLAGNYPTQLSGAINAGVDMVMAPKVHTGFVSIMDSLVPDRIPMARIDDAVARILTVKCELGMLEEDRFARDRSGSLRSDPELLGALGSEAHRAVAREAVRKSLVLLENRADLLPLNKQLGKVHLAGSGADDIGRQCGGWTITWQGETGDITPGTTIKEALEAALPSGMLSYSADGSQVPSDAQVAIAVIGEKPYAEMKGDDDDLSLSDEDIATVERLKQSGLPVVVILLSGRPMILGKVQQLADALIAAWLPGSEGAGISDVLFGEHPFTGKLPHSWPRSIAQIPINVGDANYDPLYPYGFGLQTTADTPARSEPAAAEPSESSPTTQATTPGAAMPADPDGPPARPAATAIAPVPSPLQ